MSPPKAVHSLNSAEFVFFFFFLLYLDQQTNWHISVFTECQDSRVKFRGEWEKKVFSLKCSSFVLSILFLFLLTVSNVKWFIVEKWEKTHFADFYKYLKTQNKSNKALKPLHKNSNIQWKKSLPLACCLCEN